MTVCLTDPGKVRHGGFITPSSKTWSQKCSPGAPGVNQRILPEILGSSFSTSCAGVQRQNYFYCSLKATGERTNWPGFSCGKNLPDSHFSQSIHMRYAWDVQNVIGVNNLNREHGRSCTTSCRSL